MRWFWFLVLGILGAGILFILGVFAIGGFRDDGKSGVADYAAGIAEQLSSQLVPVEIVERAHSLQPAYAVYFVGGPGREDISPSIDHPNLLRTSSGLAVDAADIRTLAFVRTEVHKRPTT